MTVLRKDPLLVGSLRYNRLTEKIDVTKVLWWNKEPCVLTNKGRKALRYFFEKYYGLFNESVMDDALDLEAYSKEYHPICEYLETLEWDGKERIRNVLKVYMGADDSDMVYEMLKHFMMGALNRIYCPGCKFDEMLCLVGQQGAGKSTFFRFLALDDQWFSDSLKNLNMEKPYELLRGHWILEMSEMTAAISAKSIEETKSFLEHISPAASLYFLYWRTAKWFGFSASNASNIRSTGFLNSSSSSRTSIALMNSIRVEKFCSSTGAS